MARPVTRQSHDREEFDTFFSKHESPPKKTVSPVKKTSPVKRSPSPTKLSTFVGKLGPQLQKKIKGIGSSKNAYQDPIISPTSSFSRKDDIEIHQNNGFENVPKKSLKKTDSLSSIGRIFSVTGMINPTNQSLIASEVTKVTSTAMLPPTNKSNSFEADNKTWLLEADEPSPDDIIQVTPIDDLLVAPVAAPGDQESESCDQDTHVNLLLAEFRSKTVNPSFRTEDPDNNSLGGHDEIPADDIVNSSVSSPVLSSDLNHAAFNEDDVRENKVYINHRVLPKKSSDDILRNNNVNPTTETQYFKDGPPKDDIKKKIEEQNITDQNLTHVNSGSLKKESASSESECMLKRIESIRASPKVVENDGWITERRRSSKGRSPHSFRAAYNRSLLRSPGGGLDVSMEVDEEALHHGGGMAGGGGAPASGISFNPYPEDDKLEPLLTTLDTDREEHAESLEAEVMKSISSLSKDASSSQPEPMGGMLFSPRTEDMKEQFLSDLFKSSITSDPVRLDFDESITMETDPKSSSCIISENMPFDFIAETNEALPCGSIGSLAVPTQMATTMEEDSSELYSSATIPVTHQQPLGSKIPSEETIDDTPSAPLSLSTTTLVRNVSSPKLPPIKKKHSVPPKTKPKPGGYKLNVNNFTSSPSPRRSKSRRESGGMKENYIQRNINAVRKESLRKASSDSKSPESQQEESPQKISLVRRDSKTLSRKDSGLSSLKKEGLDSRKRRSGSKLCDDADKGKRRSSTKLASFSDRRKFFQQMQEKKATSPHKGGPPPALTPKPARPLHLQRSPLAESQLGVRGSRLNQVQGQGVLKNMALSPKSEMDV